jgi:hypothetical protein
VALLSAALLGTARVALAGPFSQVVAPGNPGASVSYLLAQPGSGLFGRPRTAAYVQVYDRADPPVGRTALTGLAGDSFRVSEDGAAAAIASVKPVAPDEPVALIVVADTNTGRGWLLPGPKHDDPLLYLRDTTLRLLREFPANGRYAVYTMATGPTGNPALADRTTAENAAQQLQAAPEARLLERIEQAVEALKAAPPAWRRIILVLSDGNSAFGRSYEIVQSAAAREHVAVFAVGTLDPNNPFRFLDRMAQETGGQAWLFAAQDLQPQPASPVLLDVLADQAIKAIKSAYRLEFSPTSSRREQREVLVTVKLPGGAEVRTAPVLYRTDPAGGVPAGLITLLVAVPLLAVAAGAAFYYLRLRPRKTDYYLVGHGPSAEHVPEHYLYTDWRAMGRGGRGYQLTPEDPHFRGISKTHVFIRAHDGSGRAAGQVEVRAGRPGNGVGLNTSFVYNETNGVRALGPEPYHLSVGDLLILQSGLHRDEGIRGLPAGVYLRLGHVGSTETEGSGTVEVDPDKTVVETRHAGDETVIEGAPVTPPAAVSTYIAGAPPAGVSPNGGAAGAGQRKF